MDCSVIIPVYYNEGTINKTFTSISDTLSGNQHIKDYEVIFIDDGSGDNSFSEISDVVKNNRNAKAIKLTRNFGQVPAIYAGYRFAKGTCIITLSADLQDPPELINRMLDAFFNDKVEIVICAREDRDENAFRKITSSVFYSMMRRLSFENMPQGGFDYVLISRKVADYLNKLDETNIFWQGQLLWSGYSTKFISYIRQQRSIGRSRWTFGKKIKYLLDGVLAYSFSPIRLISLAGIFIFLSGLLYSVVIVIQYFFGNAPFKGWTPIMILILLLSGFQLLMLGIIGEYLWRTLDQARNRPPFLIEKIMEHEE
jgi:polyisoprenyl-phosphate glycosyltransferase